jgi:hypothetical protein
MLNLLLQIALGPLIGAASGLLAVRWFLSRHGLGESVIATEPPDPFVSAEIDQAAARWAQANGRPEAAGVVADKLHLLYALGRRRQP